MVYGMYATFQTVLWLPSFNAALEDMIPVSLHQNGFYGFSCVVYLYMICNKTKFDQSRMPLAELFLILVKCEQLSVIIVIPLSSYN